MPPPFPFPCTSSPSRQRGCANSCAHPLPSSLSFAFCHSSRNLFKTLGRRDDGRSNRQMRQSINKNSHRILSSPKRALLATTWKMLTAATFPLYLCHSYPPAEYCLNPVGEFPFVDLCETARGYLRIKIADFMPLATLARLEELSRGLSSNRSRSK